MGYVENNLLPGETVVYQSKTHWKIFLLPAALLLFGIYLLVRGWELPVYLFVGLGLIYLIPAVIRYLTDVYAVTTHRLILKQGIISTVSVEIPLNQIAAVGVSESILGRILGYGTIVYGTGGGTQPFTDITSPREFRQQANRQALTP